MGMKLLQLKAVLWKGWCSRKFHFIATAFDIIFPLLFAYILVTFKVQNTDDIEGSKIYPAITKKFLLKDTYEFSLLDILYTPNTSVTFNLMQKVRTKLNSNNIGHFLPMKNESAMENWFFNDALSNKSSDWTHGSYGIVFNEINDKNLNYSIRNTKYDTWQTNLRFPEFQLPGPMEAGAQYINLGFTALQIAIDESFMELKDVTPIDWYLQEFPYPEYRRVGKFTLVYQTMLPLLLCYGFLFSYVSLIRNVGEEKESGIRERLKLSGVKPWISYLGWIIDSGLMAFICSAAISIFLSTSCISQSGALFEKSNPLIFWITLFLFYISAILFAIVVANIFTKPKYSSMLGTFFYTATFGISTYVLEKTPPSMTLFFLSWTPNGFLLASVNSISKLEVLGTGAVFSNIFDTGQAGNTIPLGFAWIGTLCGMVISGFLIFYFDAVFPGQFGVPKPWYFIFPQKCLSTLSGRMNRNKNRIITEEEGGGDEVDSRLSCKEMKETRINCEPLLGSLPVGIKISHLYKQYGTVLALNNFSIDIYKNQITALLGHNGAGKTTLLSIITGMLPPTKGDVNTDEYDVFDNLKKFRLDLGYCPQDDILLPNMTVAQHIIFFGMISGLTRARAIAQSKVIMCKCRLTIKDNTRVSELSGGMRRKLCLAISLVNDPKILILDEPTSGLDPESRRIIWDILLELRRGRTVLLTTHFMEEADVLGDRIAIMSHGELKCYGSSLFLKKNYGSGYQVTVLLSPNTTLENVKELITLIKTEMPEASVIQESVENITVQLPLKGVIQFPQLFKELENRKDLGVTSLAVSCTTIDDVFQKVNEEEGVKFDVDEVDMPVPYNQLNTSDMPAKRSAISLIWSRIWAIGEKKLIWIYRNWLLTFFYLIFPLILIAFPTYSNSSNSANEIASIKPLLLNLKLYENSQVVIPDQDDVYTQIFKQQVKELGSEIISTPSSDSLIDELLNFARKDEAKFRTSMIISGGNMSTDSPTVLYSSIAIHSIPIAVNMLSNILLNAATDPGISTNTSSYAIYSYNYPYPFSSDTCSLLSADMAIFYFILIMQLIFVISYFMIPAHIERTTLFKELQLLTGLQFHFYWIFTFIIDLFIYFFITILLLVIMIISNSSEMIRDWNLFGNFILIFFLFGLSGLWCIYFYSFFFKTYNGATLFFMLIIMSLCIFGAVVYSVLGYTGWKYVFYLNPLNPLASAIIKILSEAKFNIVCKICKQPLIAGMCAAKLNNEYIEDFDYSTELKYLGCDWILYMALVFLIEYGTASFVWHHCKSLFIGNIPHLERSDPDVFQEKVKVEQMTGENSNSVLIVNGLAKKYSKNVIGVKDVTFAVPQGQCFGLLGTNGAGKSTTFQMLTAYIRPTNGDANLCGVSLNRNRHSYKLKIGYCPQAGGLLGELTGKETLRLFASLRGVERKEVNNLVQKWIRLLALKEYENRKSCTYSGGNMRKLSLAIALIGNPPVVFLDEPTTGVDPVTRRKIWQVLKMVQVNNQTIIITSHSMDECEALCDRLTIMVEGTMKCIGNVQYLKKAYGMGYTILIKLGIISNETLSELKRRVQTIFSASCKLQDEHKGLLHYHLEDPSYQWSTLFKFMATLKTEFTDIEDYVLTDASLEQVFLSFASVDSESNTK